MGGETFGDQSNPLSSFFDHLQSTGFILAAPLTLDTNIIGRACKTDWVELTATADDSICGLAAWDGASGTAINTAKQCAQGVAGHRCAVSVDPVWDCCLRTKRP